MASASKEIALDLAAFLDSSAAHGAHGIPTKDLRSLGQTFFTICYDDLGKKPRLLDGEDVRAMLEVLLPARLAPKDARAEHLPAMLAAFLDYLESNEVVPEAFEARRAADEHLPACVDHIRSGRNVERQFARREDPFVHRAAKLGRNDPCSCGSGKKYKKCHGKEA